MSVLLCVAARGLPGVAGCPPAGWSVGRGRGPRRRRRRGAKPVPRRHFPERRRNGPTAARRGARAGGRSGV